MIYSSVAALIILLILYFYFFNRMPPVRITSKSVKMLCISKRAGYLFPQVSFAQPLFFGNSMLDELNLMCQIIACFF